MNKKLLKWFVGMGLFASGLFGLLVLLDLRILVFLMLCFVGFAFMVDSQIALVEKELEAKQ